MIITAQHRVVLWVPSMLFAILVVGTIRRTPFSDWLFVVHKNGLWSSLLIVVAAALISKGGEGTFYAGVVCWILSLAALFLLSPTTLLVLHF